MATVGVGVDVVDVARFALVIERRPGLLARLFTDAERRDAGSRPERLAVRFAAKEAVLKSMSVGLGAASWRSIEVRRDQSGAPHVRLHADAASLAERLGVERLHVSLSHTASTAVAFVVASSTPERSRGG